MFVELVPTKLTRAIAALECTFVSWSVEDRVSLATEVTLSVDVNIATISVEPALDLEAFPLPLPDIVSAG